MGDLFSQSLILIFALNSFQGVLDVSNYRD